MPIVGNLSEFPLPEVLILIGLRTGRLRLLDVPESVSYTHLDVYKRQPSFRHLVSELKQPSSGLLRSRVVDAITTNETLFFRDGQRCV